MLFNQVVGLRKMRSIGQIFESKFLLVVSNTVMMICGSRLLSLALLEKYFD